MSGHVYREERQGMYIGGRASGYVYRGRASGYVYGGKSVRVCIMGEECWGVEFISIFLFTQMYLYHDSGL